MKIVVFGDIAVDVWLRGQPTRQAPEDSNALVYEMDGIPECTMGMAGNVAYSLAQNGHSVTIVGRVGRDAHGLQLLDFAHQAGIVTDWLLLDDGGTTAKMRGVGAMGQLVGRWDLDRCADDDCRMQSIRRPSGSLWEDGAVDAVIISDYDKGVFEQDAWMLEEIPSRLPVIADMKYNPTRRANVRVDYALPNASEFYQRIGKSGLPKLSTIDVMNFLSPTAQLTQGVVMTSGPLGASIYQPDQPAEYVVPEERDLYARYTCGAGDVFTAAFTAALLEGRGFMSLRTIVSQAVNAASHYAVTGDRTWPTL
jgi:bifunctional ADP-heptose synthase (sugar kinase/adenylyltransferase)